MNHDEIRALVADCEDEYHLLGRNTGLNVPKLRKAIETLMAREEEVLEYVERHPSMDMHVVRALLNPEPRP